MKTEEYKDALLARAQEQLNTYFNEMKEYDIGDIENELFIIKSYLFSRKEDGLAPHG